MTNKKSNVKKNAQAPKVLVVTQKKKSRSKKKSIANPMPSKWLESLHMPFSYGPHHIPDEKTACSGLVTSRINYRAAASDQGGSSTTHNTGWLIPPFISNGIFQLAGQAGSSTISDVTTLGGAYLNNVGWSNQDAIIGANGSVARYRPTSMGFRVTYEGTELNRGGKYVAGLIPINYPGRVVSSTGTVISPFSTVSGATSASISSLYQQLEYRAEARVCDGVFEYCWQPAGIPNYQIATGSSNVGALPTTGAAGAVVAPSFFNAPVGSSGCESGQYAMVFWIEGDQTPTATSIGNIYSYEFILHSEVIPSNLYSVAYDITPSMYDVLSLQRALNTIEVLPSGTVMSDAVNTASDNYSMAGSGLNSAVNHVFNGVKTIQKMYDNPIINTVFRSAYRSLTN